MVTLLWLLHIFLFVGQLNGYYRRWPHHSIYDDPCSFSRYRQRISCNSKADDEYIREFIKNSSKPEINFYGRALNITDNLFTGIEFREFECYRCNFQSETGDIFKDSKYSLNSFSITAANMQPWIKSLKNLKNITSITLTLTINSDRSIISTFDFPSTLMRLTFNYFKLHKLNKSFINPLPNLEYLQLHDDEIESIEADTFNNFHNLKEIDLSRNQLTSIVGISGLSQLEKLDLSYNDIANLSRNNFTDLKNLKHLNIEYNKITTVASQTFADLKSLTELKMSNRLLETIELGALDGLDKLKSFGLRSIKQFKIIRVGIFNNLKTINSLTLTDIGLETLEPGCFDGLNVAEIKIAGNKITKLLNGSFSNLHQLESLKLISNKIRDIEPNAFGNLPKLTELNLYFNKLNKLNRYIFQKLPALKKLLIFYNNISEIEQESFVGTNLTILNLSHNRLKTLMDFSPGLDHLETLDLSMNEIESFQPNALHNCRNLEILRLSDNKIKMLNDGVFQQLNNLKKLTLMNNKIENLAENAFNGLKNLEELDISNNLISSLSINIFQATPNLKELNLGKNQLSSLEGFSNLKNLYSLKLYRNHLKILDCSQIAMPSLKSLDLSSNNIGQIVNGELNRNLTVLCLKGNAIASTIDSFYRRKFSLFCDDTPDTLDEYFQK